MTVQPSILVGVDGTERDRDALALAQLLAKPSDAQLALVTVVPVPPAPWFENDWLSDETRDIARDVLERARELAGEAADVTLRAVEAPSPAHGLARVAEELGAVAIVVGRTHRGRLTHLAGVPERLLHTAPCAVAVAPPAYGEREPALTRVVVAFDAYPEAQVALAQGVALAAASGASVRALGVVEHYALATSRPLDPVHQESVRRARESLQQGIERAGAQADVVVEGDLGEGAAGRLLATASREADLLVCGTRGSGPLGALLLGSVSSFLSHEAACPVLAVPRGVPSLVSHRRTGIASAGTRA